MESKKWQICKNPIIYCEIALLDKKCANYIKLYIFEKPPSKFKYAKIFAKFVKPKCVFKKN